MAKQAFQFLALIIAGVVGYALAAASIDRLSEAVHEATIQLGRTLEKSEALDRQADALDRQTAELKKRNAALRQELEAVERQVTASDPVRVARLVGALEENQDASTILSRLTEIDAKLKDLRGQVIESGDSIALKVHDRYIGVSPQNTQVDTGGSLERPRSSRKGDETFTIERVSDGSP